MTGKQLIEYIKESGLEDYKVCAYVDGGDNHEVNGLKINPGQKIFAIGNE